jgi:hypothetical protein
MTLPIWGAATADTTYERRAVVCPNHHEIEVVIERQRERESSAPPPTDHVEERTDDADSTPEERAYPIGSLSIGGAVLLLGWFIVLPVAAFDGTISLFEGAAFAIVALLALITAIHPFFLVLLLVPAFFFGLAYLTYISTDGVLSTVFAGLWVLFGLLFFLPVIAPKRLVRLLPSPPDS